MAAAAQDKKSSIQVVVRVRPFTIQEAAQLTKTDDGPLFLGDGSLAAAPKPKLGQKGIRSVIKIMDDKCLVFDPPEDNPVQRFSRSVVPMGKRVKDQTFAFDRVFDENTTQADVYEATTKNLLSNIFDGYNCTVFAYGATGCGKTHTISGTAAQPGIIYLTMQELFEMVMELQQNEGKDIEVSLSFLEIYNETIRDLLSPEESPKGGLMLREDNAQAVSVAGLSSHKPQNVQEVMDLVVRGNANRTQSPTEANATSSRSHAVLQVNVSSKDRDASVNEPVTFATLSIIDLAGSERASATKNRGARLQEGANINKSLLALGSCINALCDPRRNSHVPYRNSKLTRLLKFSLGGNCRTVMIVCVSPSSQHFDETQNTLRYANRAKNIQTKSVRNVFNVDRHVKDYLKKIDEQMVRINELQAQQKDYEGVALAKFQKAQSKKAEILHEGLQRIRLAYDHSAGDRRDHINMTLRLKQLERRIGAISMWIGAFDQMCETREEEEPPASLAAMRKTAQGILIELESSRQHFHQALAKMKWTRAIETALQDGVRQLQSLDGSAPDSAEEANLKKEVELLKLRADMDVHIAVLEQEKGGESGLMQVMLTAHFETIAILGQITDMTEEDAVQAARSLLGKVVQSCVEATGQIIKPDGGLQITHAVPPTKSGTPRKKKQVPLAGPSPLKSKIRQSLPQHPHQPQQISAIPSHIAAEMQPSPNVGSSPMRGTAASPKRRVRLGGMARRGVNFTGGTPKKRSPKKQRSVKWRDEAQDEDGNKNSLVEFQPTPKFQGSSPAKPSGFSDSDEVPKLSSAFDSLNVDSDVMSSPLPALPVTHSEARKAGSGRFATGFLSKKNDGSPAMMPPPSLTLGSFSSEDDNSPLREVQANSASRRGTLTRKDSSLENKEPVADQYASSESDIERSFSSKDAQHIAKVVRTKRRSSTNGNINAVAKPRDRGSIQRRRSPTASSPPSDTGSIMSSQVRRLHMGPRDSLATPRGAGAAGNKGTIPLSARRSMFDLGGHGANRDSISSARPASRGSLVPGSANRAGGMPPPWR